MVSGYSYTEKFERTISKIKDVELKKRIFNKIGDIVENPSIGKPLGHERKGEFSVRIPPFRIVYAIAEDKICFLDFENRDEVYRN